MAMNYKAQATAQYLAQDLKNRTGLTCTADLSGTDPVVTVGNPAAGAQGAKIKVLDQRNGYAAYPGGSGAGFTDIIGNAQPVYTGTIFQIAYERSGAAGTFPAATSVTPAHLLNIVGDLTRRGGRVELWSAATGGSGADWTAFEGAFEPNLNWSISGRV